MDEKEYIKLIENLEKISKPCKKIKVKSEFYHFLREHISTISTAGPINSIQSIYEIKIEIDDSIEKNWELVDTQKGG